MGRLIAKADALLFEMADGFDIAPPLRDYLLHDPDGEVWPKCSLLVGSFKKGRGVVEDDAKAKAYFGRQYTMHEGRIELPPRSLNEWSSLGEVERIFYERKGTRAPGRYKHPFGKSLVGRLLSLFRGKDKATLYENGRWLRLELPKGCVVNDLGFVHP